ncbi:hypothetical protein CEXT_32971 [Caerostris extrusa]|uniref:Uncharacterized protein n=1 Tax=Caerostris extrusa TaxID=172846 RepID=A0AAV4SYR7_CAEEX|nr:hypothetical protein CEXT_32971 [Caerostris extrusa]
MCNIDFAMMQKPHVCSAHIISYPIYIHLPQTTSHTTLRNKKEPDKTLTKQQDREESTERRFHFNSIFFGQQSIKRRWITHCEISSASRCLDPAFWILSVMKTWASRLFLIDIYTTELKKKKRL